MTDFMRDLINFGELVIRGEVQFFDVDYYGSYVEIVPNEDDRQARQYDKETGKRIED